MKLAKILDKLNSIEKTSFSKIIDKIINDNPQNSKEIDKLLSYTDTNLKKLDSHLFTKVFNLVQDEYHDFLNDKIENSVTQLDILIDILIRDGNCIMSREWLNSLYQKEIKSIKSKIKVLKAQLSGKDISEVDVRTRDFIIYKNCVETAYGNDQKNNLDAKITADEKSILNTLADNFDLSQEEVKLLNYLIIPLETLELDKLIELLKNTGIILYSKKNYQIFIPDEFIRILRRYRNKEVADKYLRRILRLIKDSELNSIARRHGIDRKLDKRQKTKAIINNGVGIRNILKHDIYKEGTTLTLKKSRINEIVEKGLRIDKLKGSTIDQKIDSLITYFNEIEKDEKVGISIEGYNRLLEDLGQTISTINKKVKNEFELQYDDVLNSALLLDFNLKPRDILEILDETEIKVFCEKNEISTRGNEVLNILNNYKDSKNLELENYVDIAYRNLNSLKENGIKIKEADLGNKFEELTKQILIELGLNVNEDLRKELNTSKDKMDILMSIGEKQVILIECKSAKDSGYNKFSAVSRQIKSYKSLLEKNNYIVLNSLLIAPEFTDDFINEVDMDFNLNLSLMTASTLMEILVAFKGSNNLKEFPYMLLTRDVLIQEERIIKVLNRK